MPPKQTVIDINEDKLKSILEKVEARTPNKPKQGMTLREVIMKSKPMINKALKRGYTYDEVAAILTDEGISIKGATLKQYLTETKSKKSKAISATKPQAGSATKTDTESEDTDLKPEPNLNTKPETKTATKSGTKTATKSGSVVRGKFTDLPSNDDL